MEFMRNLLHSFIVFVVLLECIYSLDRSQKLTNLSIGILKKVPEESCEDIIESGDEISVIYTGKLFKDDTEFDSNVGKSPFSVTVGLGQVIKGWDRGLLGMCLGEKRKIFIPSEMGYGEQGSPPKIPGDADLVFDVELTNLKKKNKKLEL